MYVTRYVDNTHYRQSSVAEYACYLEKERLVQMRMEDPSTRRFSAYLDKQNDVVRVEGREYFFNGRGEHFDTEDVVKGIDTNVRGLKKSEARYYTFSISPSGDEIAHLRRTIADTRQALVDAGEDVPDTLEDDLMRRYLKDYAVACMDAYARNFGHPEIRDNRDLLWFGMVEKERYWKSHDREVRTNSRLDCEIARLEERLVRGESPALRKEIASLQGQYIRENKVRAGGSGDIVRAMMPKAGDNWHVHITVSRRDVTNSINLSPNANGRGSSRHVLNGKAVRVGFDREAYKVECEHAFDRLFAHHRLLTESYEASKRLRQQSAFLFERQRLRDRAARRSEAAEFRRLKYGGYKEYYESLLNAERLDGMQLMQLKGQLVRQIRRLNPSLDADELLGRDVSELQEELFRLDPERDLSMPSWGSNVAVSVGDRTFQAAGLHGYHPVRTAHKALRRGLAMRRAVDRRRDVFDRWTEIHTAEWHRDNYTFESVSACRNADCLLAQNEYLEERLHGVSVVLSNAREYMETTERALVGDFVKTAWPDRDQDVIRCYATELFGRDGSEVRTLQAFKCMARERLLPEDARRSIAEAVQRCGLPTFEGLIREIGILAPERSATLLPALERFRQERGDLLERLRSVLADSCLTNHAKEEVLLKLSFGDKGLDRALRDLRSGILKSLERQHPEMTHARLSETLRELSGALGEIRARRQEAFAKVIDDFIRDELPGYRLVIERQSQLDELLRTITPGPEEQVARLTEVHAELSQRLAPRAERIFEEHGRRMFGPDVCLRNEHDFLAYVGRHVAPDRARYYRDSLREVRSRIEEQRRAVIREIVNALPEKKLGAVRRQQGYINRFIDRHYPADVAKLKKEDLQRRVAGAAHRPLPTTEYKVLGPEVQRRIARQAAQKASQVKSVLPVTPQQIAFKAAFKLINILTKGY